MINYQLIILGQVYMKHITGVMHFFISLELMLVTTCVLYLI